MALFNYECDEVKRIIEEVSPNYPQLTTYISEWLYFYENEYNPGTPVELEYQKVIVNPDGRVDNAIPYQYKSAILKGKSEVVTGKNKCNMDEIKKGWIDGTSGVVNGNESVYIPVEVSGTITISNFIHDKNRYVYEYDASGNYLGRQSVTTNTVTLSLNENTSLIKIGFYGGTLSTVKSLKLQVEQGEIATEYEPYNATLVSVKMPVFTTTGKNLIDNTSWESGRIDNTTGEVSDNISFMRYKKYIQVKPSTTYVWKNDMSSEYKAIYEYGPSKEYIGLNGVGASLHQAVKFTTSSTTKFIKIWVKNTTVSSTNQIEESTSATDYEPYQSNILTVNEDVELRGIGDVKDELNLLTGEMVERIGEIVLNEDISGYLDTNYSVDGYSAFRLTTNANIPNELRNVICDKVKYYPNINLNWGKQEEFFTANGNLLFVKILSTKARNFEELRTFLSSSPITIQYELAESIKTVDLTTLNKPYEGTNHYQLTSNIPCEVILEVPVVSTGKQTLEEINNY